MPPRYAYWTIIVDDQPTAFRAGALEDIMPTFNRLKEKQPTAKLMWFQSGKLWPSRIDAREAMQMRGDRGRDRDPGQQRDSSDRKPVDRKPVDRKAVASGFSRSKPEWKPKSFASPKPQAPSRERERSERPEWKPKAPFKSNREQARSTWKPKPYTERPVASPKPQASSRVERSEKPDWKPRGSSSPKPPSYAKASEDRQASSPAEGKRKWVPKAEYKKSQGIEAKKDDKWRPGGEHKDPKQKYKDAKKAKWTRFKQAIRSRKKPV